MLCVRVRCQRRRTQDTMWYKVTQHWQQPSYALTTRARESLLSVSISKQWILWLATVEFITITALNVNTELRETVVPRKINCSGLILNASDSSFSILTKTEQWRHQHCFCLGLKTEDWCVSHFVTIISQHPSGVMTRELMIASNYHFHQTLPLEGFPSQAWIT